MIKSAAELPPEKIRDFLKKCHPDWSPRKLDAFLHYRLDEKETLFYIDENQVEVMITCAYREFQIHHRQYRAVMIEHFLCAPGSDFFTSFKLLLSQLEAFFKAKGMFLLAASHEDLTSLDMIRFDGIQHGILKSTKRLPNPGIRIIPYENEDLYPVYRNFLSLFDGQTVLTRDQFSHWLDGFLFDQDEIFISLDKNRADGFAIVDDSAKPAQIKVLIYERIEALLALLHFAQKKYGDLDIQVSLGEDLSKIFPIELSPSGSFYIKPLHPQLHVKAGLEANLENDLKNLDSFSWNLSLL